MIRIKDKEKCCGCAACFEVCPKKCIQMKEDEEGFLYPEVDENQCMGCGLCEKVCPMIEKYYNDSMKCDSYGAYSKNLEDRMASSSGGVFGIISSYVLERDGVVCGAAYDNEWNVSHILVDTSKELKRLRGSKYVQSINNGIYFLVKKELVKGRIVLYSGTACQVAGLKKYLQKDYENLITIDVLCHGVPTPKIWKKYINEIQMYNKSRITNINLRNKTNGWRNYNVKICFENNKNINEMFVENDYMKLFLNNICLRPSCHACKYKELQRPSDITIGDYWGIEKQMPEMDDDKGISIVKINTNKGEAIFNEISSEINYRKIDIELALPTTSDSRKSVARHSNREKFFRQIDKKTVEQLVDLLKTSRWRRRVRKLKKYARLMIKRIRE